MSDGMTEAARERNYAEARDFRQMSIANTLGQEARKRAETLKQIHKTMRALLDLAATLET